MDDAASQFELLDREHPQFRERWAALLGGGMRHIDRLTVQETVEGGALLYKGSLILSLIEAALLYLPETEDSTDTLDGIQRALANARRGAQGPLILKGVRSRGRPPMDVKGVYVVASVATAVRVLAGASATSPGYKTAVQEVTAIVKTYGVRDSRGSRLNEEKVEEWVERAKVPDSAEYRAALWHERNTPLPVNREAAMLEVRDLARDALAAQNLS